MKRSYFKKLKNLPILLQLSMLGLFIVAVMMSIMAVNYYRAIHVVKKNNSDYIKGVISQLNHSIASNSNDIKRIMETIAYNGQTIQTFLTVTDATQKFEMYKQVKDYMSDMKGMKTGILDIAMVDKNGVIFNLNSKNNHLPALSQEIPRNNLSHFLGLKMIDLSDVSVKTTPVLVAGIPIYSTSQFDPDNKELGTLLVTMDNRMLFGDGNPVHLPMGALVYMTDRNGKLFYTNDDSSKLGEPVSQDLLSNRGGQYIIQKEAIPDLGGEIVIEMPNRVLLQGLNEVRRQQLVMVCIALIFMIIPLLFVRNNILQPLRKFMKLMGEVSLGEKQHLRKRIEVEGYAEMTIMAARFNEMLTEIENLTDRLLDSERTLYETELIKRRAELTFLQSQINPHFLYNTFESIKGLAVRLGATQIFELTRALSLFFRYSIKGPDMVSLEEEWNIVRNYILIHQIRFGTRLQVEYDIHAECLGCLVPKMILQPIVENAIKHGIEPLERTGILVIRGYRSGEILHLSVEDNGPGISSDKLEEIQRSMERRSATEGFDSESGIGLANVHDRIRIKFGEPYGIRMTSSLLCGTTVSLTIPVRGEGYV
jgi:two-component system, sensor histidine kinase YesM